MTLIVKAKRKSSGTIGLYNKDKLDEYRSGHPGDIEELETLKTDFGRSMKEELFVGKEFNNPEAFKAFYNTKIEYLKSVIKDLEKAIS